MTRFYTKTGDDGYTSLLGKGRVAKHDPRIETVGAIDEANAAIALARTLCKNSQTSSTLMSRSERFVSPDGRSGSNPRNCPTVPRN